MVQFLLPASAFFAAVVSTTLMANSCVSAFSTINVAVAPIHTRSSSSSIIITRSTTTCLYSDANDDDDDDDDDEEEDEYEIHPAVLEWPDKYCQNDDECGLGPRVLHMEFTVEKGNNDELVEDLDAKNWPTWTTADKEKWAVGNQVKDKIMPYGELSYMIKGELEIIPTGREDEVYIVEAGDLVTFPEGFQASWRVLEELTWHYFLY